MEFVISWAVEHGINTLGWIIALGLAFYLLRKLINNQEKTTETLTEITKVSAVQQEQIKGLREDVDDLNAAVFIVNYKRK